MRALWRGIVGVALVCMVCSTATAQLRRRDIITVAPLHVVDSLGRSLGEARFVSFSIMAVALRVPDTQHVVAVPVYSWGFEHNTWDTRIGYATPDCTGQAYFTLPQAHLGLLTQEGLITTPGSTLWALEVGAVEEIVTIQSTWSLSCRPVEVIEEWLVAKARKIVDLDTLYTPPFRLDYRPK